MDNSSNPQVAKSFTQGGARLQISNNAYQTNNYQKNGYQHPLRYQGIGCQESEYTLSRNSVERLCDETDSSIARQISNICQTTECPSPQAADNKFRNQNDDVIIYQEGTPGAAAKGLRNAPGQNNCFLNSAVQVLWHLDVFRRSLRTLSAHACAGDTCIFCALKELFSQLQYSAERVLAPDSLRRALAGHSSTLNNGKTTAGGVDCANISDKQNEQNGGDPRFRLGSMADASECFEHILLRLHAHLTGTTNANGSIQDFSTNCGDSCTSPNCVPHRKVAISLLERSVCQNCSASSESLPFTQMVHYVSASAVTSQHKTFRQQGNNAANGNPNNGSNTFGLLLRAAGGMGDIRDCPNTCGAKIQIHRTLTNTPDIISVGVVWDSANPSQEHVAAVLDAVGTSLRPGDVFHWCAHQAWARNTSHSLVGVVAYYGKHYSTYFFHTKLKVWVYFDDATVQEIGPHWEQVVERCKRGRCQPLLLLYANPNGSPIENLSNNKVITQNTNIMSNGLTDQDSSPAQMLLNQNHMQTMHIPNAVVNSNNFIQQSANNQNYSMTNGVQNNPAYNQTTSSQNFSQNSSNNNQQHSNGSIHHSNSMMASMIRANTPSNMEKSLGYVSGSGMSIQQQQMRRCLTPVVGNRGQITTNVQNDYQNLTVIQEAMSSNGGPQSRGLHRSLSAGSSMPHMMQQHHNQMQQQSNNHHFAQGYNGQVVNQQYSQMPNSQHNAIQDKSQNHLQGLHQNGLNQSAMQTLSHLPVIDDGLNDSNIPRRRDSLNHQQQGVTNLQSGMQPLNHMPLSGINQSAIQTLSQGGADSLSLDQQNDMALPDHIAMNLPRRRDSGNWSGDRNSASSASSTTATECGSNPAAMLNFHSLHGNGNGGGKRMNQLGLDQGYDSYSLSSTDSSSHMSTCSNSKSSHMQSSNLAQIPEQYDMHSPLNYDCEQLCDEVERLLEASRRAEDAQDLNAALAFCSRASSQARLAINAPYSNPRAMTRARMKHNTCVMRARGLQKRMDPTANPQPSHSRQNSKDKTLGSASGRISNNHSRQNSRDSIDKSSSIKSHEGGLNQQASNNQNSSTNTSQFQRKDAKSSDNSSVKNIEIYATLPKRNKLLTPPISPAGQANQQNSNQNSTNTVINTNERSSRSIFGRQKDHSKRSRSEDRSKMQTDLSIMPDKTESLANAKDTLLRKNKDEEKIDKDKEKSGKKQHKVRRKLLMGGLIRRRNRSMPDLTENEEQTKNGTNATKDDSSIPAPSPSLSSTSSGYLSEGHLEYQPNGNVNSSMERSKLMRKSFHSKVSLTAARVPPPPPLRTTSQLSFSPPSTPQINPSNGPRINVEHMQQQQQNQHQSNLNTTIVTRADVHQEQNPPRDEVDFISAKSVPIMNKSEYVLPQKDFLSHSQMKNDIVPAQTCIRNKADFINNMVDKNHPLNTLEYITNSTQLKNDFVVQTISTQLKSDFNTTQHAQISNLNTKSDFVNMNDNGLSLPPYPSPKGSTCHSRQHSEEFPPPPLVTDNSFVEEITNKELSKEVSQSKDGNWLRELQQALRSRKDSNSENNNGIDNQETGLSAESSSSKSVRDLASRFERAKISVPNNTESTLVPNIKTGNTYHQNTYVPQKQQKIAPDQIAEELREVERLNAAVHKTLNKSSNDQNLNSVNLPALPSYGNTTASYNNTSSSPYTVINNPLNCNASNSNSPSYGMNTSQNFMLNNPTPNTSHNSENTSHNLSNISTNSTNGSYNTTNNSYSNLYNNDSMSPSTVNNRNISTANYSMNSQTQSDIAPTFTGNNMANAKILHAATIQNINNEINNMISGSKYPAPYTNPPKYPGYTSRYGANNLPYGQNGSIHDLDYTNASNIMVVNGGFRNTQNFNNSSPANDMAIIGSQVNNTNNVNAVNSNADSNIAASTNAGSAGNNIGNDTRTKKKSVSFCDQVILVATADEDEEDGFIPNPILERVLRSANGIQTEAIRLQTQQALARQDSREKLLQQDMQFNNSQTGYQQQQFHNQMYNPNGRAPVMNPYQQVPSPLTIQAHKAQVPPQSYAQQNMSNGLPYKTQQQPQQIPPYQRVPQPHADLSNYMDTPTAVATPYQLIPQKVPSGNYQPQMVQQQNCSQQRKKSVSFEPGTKGGCDSPTPKIAIATVNTNTAIVKASAKAVICNLCRKKHVVAPNVYCGDCDFYMARFRPRT